MQTNLPLSKKIFFSLAIIIVFFLTLELMIRVYHSIKFKEKTYLFYGAEFVKKLINEATGKSLAKIYKPYMVIEEAEDAFLKRREFASRSLLQDHEYAAIFRRWDWFTAEKKPGTIRIIATGGSFVHGLAVGDTETWPYLLGEELNEHSIVKKYEVMNCSHGGKNINDILIWLIWYLTSLKPDYLIVVSVYNNTDLVKAEYEVSFAWKLSHFLYNISRFYSTVRDKVAIMLSKDIYFFHETYDARITEDKVETAINLYRNRLKQILTVCRENNITLILGLQPIFLPENLKNLENLLDEKQLIELGKKVKERGRLLYHESRYYMQGRFNFELKHFAESQGILLFDGVSIFPKDRHQYYIDAIHLNRKGTVIFAKELYLFFLKNGLVSTK